MSLPNWRDWVFALKVLAAAVLALFIALWIDLPRPYSGRQHRLHHRPAVRRCDPLEGHLSRLRHCAGRHRGGDPGAKSRQRARAAYPRYRALGRRLPLCLALDRTPRSYILMLAGYTAAFIGFPAVADPGAIFDTAVARAEEITLGILCASLVGSIVLPQSVAPAIAARLDQWFAPLARGVPPCSPVHPRATARRNVCTWRAAPSRSTRSSRRCATT